MNNEQALQVMKQVTETAMKAGALGLQDSKTAIVALETLEADQNKKIDLGREKGATMPPPSPKK